MKKIHRFIIVFFLLLVALTFPSFAADEIRILFTHDLHDNFMAFDLFEDGVTKNVGGFARLYSAIKEERKKDPDLLLVDAGDYSMGTLFQTIFTSESPSLRMFGLMGY